MMEPELSLHAGIAEKRTRAIADFENALKAGGEFDRKYRALRDLPDSDSKQQKLEELAFQQQVFEEALLVLQDDAFKSADTIQQHLQTLQQQQLKGKTPAGIEWSCRVAALLFAFFAIAPGAMYSQETHSIGGHPVPEMVKDASTLGTWGTYGSLVAMFMNTTLQDLCNGLRKCGEKTDALKDLIINTATLGFYARWAHKGKEPGWMKALFGAGFTLLEICCIATYFTPWTQFDQMKSYLPWLDFEGSKEWMFEAQKYFLSLNAPNTNLRLGWPLMHRFIDYICSRGDANRDVIAALCESFKERANTFAHLYPKLFVDLSTEFLGAADDQSRLSALLKIQQVMKAYDQSVEPVREELKRRMSDSGIGLGFLQTLCIGASAVSSIPGALVAAHTKIKGLPDWVASYAIGPAAYAGNIPLSVNSGLTLAQTLKRFWQRPSAFWKHDYKGLLDYVASLVGCANMAALVLQNIGQVRLNPPAWMEEDTFIAITSSSLVGLGLMTGTYAAHAVATACYYDPRARGIEARMTRGDEVSESDLRLLAKTRAGEMIGRMDALQAESMRRPRDEVAEMLPPELQEIARATSALDRSAEGYTALEEESSIPELRAAVAAAEEGRSETDKALAALRVSAEAPRDPSDRGLLSRCYAALFSSKDRREYKRIPLLDAGLSSDPRSRDHLVTLRSYGHR